MVRLFDEDSDFCRLRSWCEARSQFGLELWMLPELGYVCDDKAMAFLVLTNSPVVWIAHWAVDPRLSKRERDVVVKELAETLEQTAKAKGYRLLQTMARANQGMALRLDDMGFKTDYCPYQFFVKEL